MVPCGTNNSCCCKVENSDATKKKKKKKKRLNESRFPMAGIRDLLNQFLTHVSAILDHIL